MSLSSNIRAGRAYVEVTAETSKLQRNLTSAQAQLQNFGRTCTNVGKDLLMLSGAMAAPLVMAARSFAGFDDSMRLVQAVTQATDADFKALTKTRSVSDVTPPIPRSRLRMRWCRWDEWASRRRKSRHPSMRC